MDFLKSLTIDPSVKVGDLLAAISIVIGVIAAYISMRQFQRTMSEGRRAEQAAYYTELDGFYDEILKAGLDMPHLRTPAKIADDADALAREYVPIADHDPDKRARYDTYAYMVWNFIETVHDRCADIEPLRATWGPVIRAEDALHRGWFLAQMRNEAKRKLAEGEHYRDTHKFCEPFRIFVVERQWDEKNKKDDEKKNKKKDKGAWAYRDAWQTPLDFGFEAAPDTIAAEPPLQP
jgi:hypothetical protein